MFQRLFGGPTKSGGGPVSSNVTTRTMESIQQLSETLELLEKRKEVLEKRIEAELEKAKQCVRSGNKTGATMAIKKKALLIKQLEGMDNNIMRLMEQQQTLEVTQLHVQTVSTMKEAASVQKATMAQFKIEKVEEVMDEIQEAADQAAEIERAMAVPLGTAAGIDEDDLAAELAEMEALQLDEELMQPATIPSKLPAAGERLDMPSVPSTKPSKAKTTEDELAELEAELAAS